MDITEPRLGIDIGRVIIDGDGADTSFLHGDLASALCAPAVPGSFAAIARLVDRFEGRVWLVSKCGARVQDRSRRWLHRAGFHTVTGIPAEHLRFCRERPQKADHCRTLRLTHFVDDRTDVLDHLDGLVPHRFLFGPQRRPAPAGLVPVLDWAAAETAIPRRLPSAVAR